MRIRRSRILAAILSLLVAFHWLPGALAASAPALGVICGELHSAQQHGSFQPGSDDHGCKHECKLCSGAGVSAPAIVAPATPGAIVVSIDTEFTCPHLASSLWAPVWARPPPRG